MNGKVNQITEKAKELYAKLLPGKRFVQKVNMPKGVQQFF